MQNRHKNKVEYRHQLFIDFWLICGPFLEPKSVQNRFQSGFGRALIEDSDSKPKKDKVKSVLGAMAEHKQEDFAPSGGGKQGGGKWLHTPDVPWTSQGVGGSPRSVGFKTSNSFWGTFSKSMTKFF